MHNMKTYSGDDVASLSLKISMVYIQGNYLEFESLICKFWSTLKPGSKVY